MHIKKITLILFMIISWGEMSAQYAGHGWLWIEEKKIDYSLLKDEEYYGIKLMTEPENLSTLFEESPNVRIVVVDYRKSHLPNVICDLAKLDTVWIGEMSYASWRYRTVLPQCICSLKISRLEIRGRVENHELLEEWLKTNEELTNLALEAPISLETFKTVVRGKKIKRLTVPVNDGDIIDTKYFSASLKSLSLFHTKRNKVCPKEKQIKLLGSHLSDSLTTLLGDFDIADTATMNILINSPRLNFLGLGWNENLPKSFALMKHLKCLHIKELCINERNVNILSELDSLEEIYWDVKSLREVKAAVEILKKLSHVKTITFFSRRHKFYYSRIKIEGLPNVSFVSFSIRG
ncbi:hypothetical protein [Saprospira grandis]|uniref:Leucine-rich repeat domain-containing protein n=1 Tax=Saprospira grandis (strain Lewin) TaxID=984262 RepID=H6L8B6_SAPGL|nr:hypothetical protein [Saprospira grandis]AFC26480.1 hypothetical protein SGRA_3764 [Saprospira grandis str. Lewin]